MNQIERITSLIKQHQPVIVRKPETLEFSEVIDGVNVEFEVDDSRVWVHSSVPGIAFSSWCRGLSNTSKADEAVIAARNLADFVNAARVGFSLRDVTHIFECITLPVEAAHV